MKKRVKALRPEVVIYVDGACRGNPGPGGAGVVICDEKNNPLREEFKFLGRVTNNEAEYQALLLGLEIAKKMYARKVVVKLDSELVYKQITGEYRVRDERIKDLVANVRNLLKNFTAVDFCHIPRTENRLADKLANRAINLKSF